MFVINDFYYWHVYLFIYLLFIVLLRLLNVITYLICYKMH